MPVTTRGGKGRTNYRGPAVRKGTRGLTMLNMFLFLSVVLDSNFSCWRHLRPAATLFTKLSNLSPYFSPCRPALTGRTEYNFVTGTRTRSRWPRLTLPQPGGSSNLHLQWEGTVYVTSMDNGGFQNNTGKMKSSHKVHAYLQAAPSTLPADPEKAGPD